MQRKRKGSPTDSPSYLSESENDSLESDHSTRSESSDILKKKSRKRSNRSTSSDSEDGNNSSESADDWQYEDSDNVPTIWNNAKVAGINSIDLRRLGRNASALEIFYEVLTKDFWEMIANETNRYAKQMLAEDNLKRKKLDKDWHETNSDEIQVYVALCLLMTQVKKLTVHMNWSKRKIIETPIYSKTMPYKRFQEISRFLHFTNNEDANKSDRLNKVSNVVKYMNDRFKQVYTPQENVSLNVSVMKSRSRLGFSECNRVKRTRCGVKYFKFCEATSGYCVGFQIYTGREKIADPGVSGCEEKRVESGEVSDKGKQRLETESAGTVEVTKSKCIIESNTETKAEAERHDQSLACFPVMKKFVKGYRKMFFYMLDMALFNAYVLFCKLQDYPTKSKRHFVDFRLDVAENLLNTLTIPCYNVRGRPSQGDTPLRLQAKHWAHFPQHIPPTKKKKKPTRECKVCKKHKKRRETTWECKQCLVALHVPQCFEIYHTVIDY